MATTHSTPGVSVCALPTPFLTVSPQINPKVPKESKRPSKKTRKPHMNGEHEEGKKINKRVVDMLERNCVCSRGFRKDNYMNGCHSYLLHLQVFALISCQDPSVTRALRDVVTEP